MAHIVLYLYIKIQIGKRIEVSKLNAYTVKRIIYYSVYVKIMASAHHLSLIHGVGKHTGKN